MFFAQFVGTFDTLFAVLGDGLLASYLLARYQIKTDGARAEFDEEEIFNFDLPPQEAIDYFRSKQVVTRKEFDELRVQARSAAFTVGGIYRDDVLEGFKEEIARALENGTPQREVIKRFRSILDGAGHKQLGSFHLETVLDKSIECHPLSPLHLEALFRLKMREAHHCGTVGARRVIFN
ncbi:MAG TPA: hypothetical protein VE732_02980 [Nitrososphaera sp.]|jgi:uncharacterized protein with gpF-like domain|nr:hypothetical protein [Nitrososphaera sp.]